MGTQQWAEGAGRGAGQGWGRVRGREGTQQRAGGDLEGGLCYV